MSSSSRRCRAERVALLLPTVLALAACASPCGPGHTEAVHDTLFFGTARPGGVVSADDWARFVDGVVTPRFPQGLTVWPAEGQWRSADGSVLKEASKVLTLVHPADPASEDSIRVIADTYKRQFQQEAVMRVRTSTCISF